MNVLNYFLDASHWSLPWLIGLGLVFIGYLLLLRTAILQKVSFFSALLFIYITIGSPVSQLNNFGLHSVIMLQQFFILMLVPVLILKSLPSELFKETRLASFNFSKNPSYAIVAFWIIGAIAMWGGHLLSAAILSSKTGVAICGIVVSKGSWITHIPGILIMGLVLWAGLIFSFPIFHPDSSKRLAPVASVIYLFTACLSCSLLGLYVAFSASAASAAEAVPFFTTLRNPIPLSVRTDQEIAGMIMWVPGCIFYVVLSMGILLRWYNDPITETEKNPETIKTSTIPKKTIQYGNTEQI
ncbi:cytochrome c oxidase assembly protein [Aequorivita capsosiphonis]|uniref:cytochrome c oxidase assembly protein n=1 Tax=Aequorivita capsosiphonis TaxID=487317 RepID=UPI0004799A91|nr:cytochrome c oxidase assembly protein [Aequorivita capsosiphonis]